ncbi:prolipoprotein diacylglyceryl transferase [Christensenellaceae bacterium OttesenSCG-928-K19]|nr:prolipoprotein diacylglyceryl transferase [Christensenellaceae bacterium OttesenSCG-928-K19]
MHPELFSIGPITVHSYGLMIAIGMLAAILTGTFRAKRKGLSQNIVWGIALFGILGGMVGAKLLFYILDIERIIQDPSILLDFGNGFVIYGGIIGGILAAWLYCRKKKTAFVPYLDLLLPSVSIAQGFGRIGCFLAGCCYGRETDSWLGVIFPAESLAPEGVALIPTQLISAAGDFTIAVILMLMARRQKYDGQITENFLLFYGVGRFAVEMLRNDPRGAVGILSTSQLISVFIVATGVVWKIWNSKKRKITA